MAERRKILFIIGFPRCGTKLLRTVLNNHDAIFITQELMFLPWLLENWDRFGDLSEPNNFTRMHGEITRTYYFAVRDQQGMNLIGADEWYRACDRFDPAGVLSPLIRHETKAPEDADVWLGDKSPNYTTNLALIKDGIPEAKFIHIVRDVRDAALSARKIWNKNVYRFAQRWADGMRELRRDVEEVDPSDFLELRYEDLLREPVKTLAGITAFLGLDFDERMLSLAKPSENFGDARSSRGILPGNVQKYKTQLAIREQEKIESICGSMLSTYGYEVDNPSGNRRLPGMVMAGYLIADIYYRLKFDLRLGRGLPFIIGSLASRYRTRL